MIDTIKVNLRNPSQYFACCGVLELASLRDPSSAGRFADDAFVLDSACGLRDALNTLQTARVQPIGNPKDDVPLILHIGGASILLDWWTMDSAQTTKLKCWSKGAGGCASYLLFTNTQKNKLGVLVASQRLLRADYDPAAILSLRTMAKRLDVDPRSSWQAVDIGYSPNDNPINIEAYVVTELLAAIGLQRLRLRLSDEEYFEYYAWTIPLCVQTIAAANYCDSRCRKFRFYRESRSKNNSRFTFAEEQFDV